VDEGHRKARIREYKEARQPAGLYRVRNTATGKSLIGSSVNLPGMLNRQRFQLELGSHPDKELQKDWNEFGPGAFAFEVLDRLEPLDEPAADPAAGLRVLAADLRALQAMWIEKLTESGEPLYPQSRRG
jgi:hypothetical protein